MDYGLNWFPCLMFSSLNWPVVSTISFAYFLNIMNILCIFNISSPTSKLYSSFCCVSACVRMCVTLSCEAESQVDSSPCWQRNTAGRLITAHTRQALTGASPLLTSQWHQMLCVYLHVHLLVYMWAFYVCACIHSCTKIKNKSLSIKSSPIHPSNFCISMGSASSWHCGILCGAALPSSDTGWQRVHTGRVLLSISGTMRLQWQYV